MKKFFIGLGVVVFIGVVGIVIFAFFAAPSFKQFASRAKQKEAFVTMMGAYVSLASGTVETGQYRQEDFDKFIQDQANLGGKNLYTITTSHPQCEDCGIFPDRFKIIAVGNIDDDATEDIWTMDHEKKLENLSDDIKN